MSFSIRPNPFAAQSHLTAKRAPLIIEGQATVESVQTKPQPASTNAKNHANSPPDIGVSSASKSDQTYEGRPELDNEQLFGAKRILPPRSPLAAFAQAAPEKSRVGVSIDIFV